MLGGNGPRIIFSEFVGWGRPACFRSFAESKAGQGLGQGRGSVHAACLWNHAALSQAFPLETAMAAPAPLLLVAGETAAGRRVRHGVARDRRERRAIDGLPAMGVENGNLSNERPIRAEARHREQHTWRHGKMRISQEFRRLGWKWPGTGSGFRSTARAISLVVGLANTRRRPSQLVRFTFAQNSKRILAKGRKPESI